jgi:hypothetical protein
MKKELKKLILVSFIVSASLYFLGLLTGLRYGGEISKIFEDKSSKLAIEIKKVSNELDELRILSLSNFLSEEEKCELLKNILEKSKSLKEEYYKILPSRLEEYEMRENLPTRYLEIKSNYQELQLKEWLLVMNFKSCNEKTIPILYFYKPGCALCIKQGEEMDKIRDFLKEKGYLPFVYTIDVNYQSPILSFMKKIYNISDAPSFVFYNTSFTGFTSFDIFKSYFDKTSFK